MKMTPQSTTICGHNENDPNQSGSSHKGENRVEENPRSQARVVISWI